MTNINDSVWVFHGAKGRFAGAVFSRLTDAEAWIGKHGLTGVLTAYPLNVGVYDWSVEKGFFAPKKPDHSKAEFIGSFSSGSQEHYHYEGGVRQGG